MDDDDALLDLLAPASMRAVQLMLARLTESGPLDQQMLAAFVTAQIVKALAPLMGEVRAGRAYFDALHDDTVDIAACGWRAQVYRQARQWDAADREVTDG
jgi:hypothetical protein